MHLAGLAGRSAAAQWGSSDTHAGAPSSLGRAHLVAPPEEGLVVLRGRVPRRPAPRAGRVSGPGGRWATCAPALFQQPGEACPTPQEQTGRPGGGGATGI